MNFDLTEEQKLLKQTIRDFAETQITPGAAERDEAARFPTELIPQMAELGLFGIMIPQEYGGAGLDTVSAAIIVEEIARVDAAVALIVASHNSLCAAHISSRSVLVVLQNRERRPAAIPSPTFPSAVDRAHRC